MLVMDETQRDIYNNPLNLGGYSPAGHIAKLCYPIHGGTPVSMLRKRNPAIGEKNNISKTSGKTLDDFAENM